MQLPIEPNEHQFVALTRAVHDDRIDRFLPAAAGSREDAFRLYLWNCRLCEAFYLPMHFGEIAVRNAIHEHMIDRLGEKWFENKALIGTLDETRRSALAELLLTEKRRHGDALTCHHLVSELSFGFWQHLLTKRFGRIIWGPGIRSAFPNLPNAMDRQEVHDRVEVVRKWRNRIAHHKPIFDRGPSAKYQDILQLTRWVCHDVADWVASASDIAEAIDLRPVPNTK
jgi:hypothetical protein